MKANSTLKTTLVAIAFAALCTAEAQADVGPSYLRVRSLSYNGSGCPAGSVAGRTSDDRNVLSFFFDQFVAEVGPGVPFNQKRKNCQINVDLDFPSGWSYSVRSVSHRGYLSLGRGVRATLSASLYFQGQRQTATLRSNFTGSIDRDFQVLDTLGSSAQVWSPCGAQRSLNVNTSITLDNFGASGRKGLMIIDSDSDLPGGVSDLELQWTRCR